LVPQSPLLVLGVGEEEEEAEAQEQLVNRLCNGGVGKRALAQRVHAPEVPRVKTHGLP